MKQMISQLVTEAVQRVAHRNEWEGLADFTASIERPKQPEHGDFASNAAMVLGGRLKQPPRAIADWVCEELAASSELIESTEIAGPGFINIRLANGAWQRALPQIEDAHFARPNLGKGEKVLIEYVSANPTGPLHVGNARGGPLGDCLARILSQCGYDVTTEYYINDIGGQVDRLGESILHWMRITAGIDSVLPEGGYFGDYVKELAHDAAKHPERNYLAEDNSEAVDQLAHWGVQQLLEEIRRDCEGMGSTFDRWISEADLRKDVGKVLDELSSKGVTREAEGALWFMQSEEAGRNIEDRDSVLKKSNGEPTYFADDIVCHLKRYSDGFKHIINVWGANHHGHIPRVQAALEALGHDPKSLEVVLYQYVRVCRGSDTVKMSKRAGNYVTAREVLDEVGPDAMRFFLLQRSPTAHLDFDLDLAKKESSENPIYYIQYAHARICSIQKKAAQHGIEVPDFEEIDPGFLNLPEELKVIQFLFEYPEVIEKAAVLREPHHIAYYLLECASRFHNYYSKAKENPEYRVISDEIDSSRAKLYLLRVIKSVLADGLQILNLTAPEEMRSPPEEPEGELGSA